jgi:hypothetical protein
VWLCAGYAVSTVKYTGFASIGGGGCRSGEGGGSGTCGGSGVVKLRAMM